MEKFDKEIGVSGLLCPIPIIRAEKALAGMATGEVLHVIATDPATTSIIPAIVRQERNELVGTRKEGDKYYYLIRKT